MKSHIFNPSILRAYDIRGIVDETLSPRDAFFLGKSFVHFLQSTHNLKKPRIVIASDCRLSSPHLLQNLENGILDTGADLVNIGIGPTPMLYFAVHELAVDAGIMVTGSHNPANYNGFKIMLCDGLFTSEDIQTLGKIAANGEWQIASEASSPKYLNLLDQYTTRLLDGMNFGEKKLKIVIDSGNGAAGAVLPILLKRLPKSFEITVLYQEMDGRFPNHHPDPTVSANLQDLINEVGRQKADFGLAFDGDADRIGLVSDRGEIIHGDQIIALLASKLLENHSGATVIADVKASQYLFDYIAQHGGKALMWKTGHLHIKSKMKETGALLAGEMSGHIFFADRYYGFDDAIYAALRLIEIVSNDVDALRNFLNDYPKSYSTPETKIYIYDSLKFQQIKRIKDLLDRDKVIYNDIDGVRICTEDGWWLIRASNTEAALITRCEASSEIGLARLEAQLAYYGKFHLISSYIQSTI